MSHEDLGWNSQVLSSPMACCIWGGRSLDENAKKMRSRVTEGVSMINMMIPPSPRPNGPSRSRPKFYILNNSKTFAWQCNMMSSPNKDSGV